MNALLEFVDESTLAVQESSNSFNPNEYHPTHANALNGLLGQLRALRRRVKEIRQQSDGVIILKLDQYDRELEEYQRKVTEAYLNCVGR